APRRSCRACASFRPVATYPQHTLLWFTKAWAIKTRHSAGLAGHMTNVAITWCILAANLWAISFGPTAGISNCSIAWASPPGQLSRAALSDTTKCDIPPKELCRLRRRPMASYLPGITSAEYRSGYGRRRPIAMRGRACKSLNANVLLPLKRRQTLLDQQFQPFATNGFDSARNSTRMATTTRMLVVYLA